MDSFPLNLVKANPCAVDEGYLSARCKFTILMLSMLLMSGVKHDLDMEVNFDFCEGGPSKGARPKIIIYMDCAFL